MKLIPSDYRVDYGHGLHCLFQEQARAEQKAADLHGIVVPLYDLRSEEEKAAAQAYLDDQSKQL